MKKLTFLFLLLIVLGVMTAVLLSCSPQKAEMVRPVKIADNDFEPANWGKAYPVNYEPGKRPRNQPPRERASINGGSTRTGSPTTSSPSSPIWRFSSADGVSASSTTNRVAMPLW
jgi:hypothetical protein